MTASINLRIVGEQRHCDLLVIIVCEKGICDLTVCMLAMPRKHIVARM
jgi:hypothetical protein